MASSFPSPDAVTELPTRKEKKKKSKKKTIRMMKDSTVSISNAIGLSGILPPPTDTRGRMLAGIPRKPIDPHGGYLHPSASSS
ncbi:hypothetical protein CEXT_413361 [Caerostris extrusa]|uniref:Uncharacterized protein n=1 Tax=Caerostris extrusa TaxID=172846 RepID=A0AAV4MZG9_CAEEX|nr:hypothetical protein CEXT_413361 [Caerostris extrusa]